MDYELIDTTAMLKTFIDSIGADAILYIDLEGNNLGREGTLSLVTILVEEHQKVHLVDVTSLKEDAFSVAGSNGQTLKQILESSEITKVFFDIRGDSDALYKHHQVSVGGIEDLQLMELGSRSGSKKQVTGLASAIKHDAQVSTADSKAWRKAKFKTKSRDFSVFDKRPLSEELLKYSVQDVVHMPTLRNTYTDRLTEDWKAKVYEETVARIALSQSADFNGKGEHMTLGPAAWQEEEEPRKGPTLPDSPEERGPPEPLDEGPE